MTNNNNNLLVFEIWGGTILNKNGAEGLLKENKVVGCSYICTFSNSLRCRTPSSWRSWGCSSSKCRAFLAVCFIGVQLVGGLGKESGVGGSKHLLPAKQGDALGVLGFDWELWIGTGVDLVVLLTGVLLCFCCGGVEGLCLGLLAPWPWFCAGFTLVGVTILTNRAFIK